jgi:hypothetical protein
MAAITGRAAVASTLRFKGVAIRVVVCGADGNEPEPRGAVGCRTAPEPDEMTATFSQSAHSRNRSPATCELKATADNLAVGVEHPLADAGDSTSKNVRMGNKAAIAATLANTARLSIAKG